MEKLQSWPRKKKKCRAYISKDAQIKALKERNDELEKRIKELEQSIEQLEIELQ
jgi:cell division protein FtsB